MKRIVLLLIAGSLLLGCLPVAGKAPDATRTPRAILTITPREDVQVIPKTKRPNILFIISDDLDLELGTLSYMPHLQELMTSQGLTIEDFFISQPLCCPSRSTFLRDQFTHNHKVFRNDQPNGGFEEFYSLQNESSTLATWLQAADYQTVLLGKYLKGYMSNIRTASSNSMIFYDMIADPAQMVNIAANADQALLSILSERLHALSACSGRKCGILDQGVIK